MKTGDLNRKNVSLHIPTYDRIGEYGGMGDSFTDVIDAIIDFAESRGMNKTSLKEFRAGAK